MNIPKGGRGHKAPYETTHVRIPTAIKNKVEELSNNYKLGIEEKGIISKNEAINIAREIINDKKSARISMSKLLTSIYGEEIKL